MHSPVPSAGRPLPIIVTASLLSACLVPLASGLEDGDVPIIAAQVHVLGGNNWVEIGIELDRLREAGFNTIFFRVFQNKRDRYHNIVADRDNNEQTGVYFQTSSAPVIEDMLTKLADLCRRRGMRLFAWMTTRSMDWLEEESWLDDHFDLETRKLQTNSVHDLFNNEFTTYLFDLYSDLARLPVDGIVIQDDFVIKSYEGFTVAAISGYEEKFGVIPKPELLFQKIFLGSDGRFHVGLHGSEHERWRLYLADHLNTLGRELVKRCKDERVNLAVVMNVYYDTVHAPEKAVAWLGQSLDAVSNSPFDHVCLMAYHRQAAAELDLSVTEAIALMGGLSTQLWQNVGDRLIIKLQTVDWAKGEKISAEELTDMVEAVKAPVNNWALAPIESAENGQALAAAGMLAGKIVRQRQD